MVELRPGGHHSHVLLQYKSHDELERNLKKSRRSSCGRDGENSHLTRTTGEDSPTLVIVSPVMPLCFIFVNKSHFDDTQSGDPLEGTTAAAERALR